MGKERHTCQTNALRTSEIQAEKRPHWKKATRPNKEFRKRKKPRGEKKKKKKKTAIRFWKLSCCRKGGHHTSKGWGWEARDSQKGGSQLPKKGKRRQQKKRVDEEGKEKDCLSMGKENWRGVQEKRGGGQGEEQKQKIMTWELNEVKSYMIALNTIYIGKKDVRVMESGDWRGEKKNQQVTKHKGGRENEKGKGSSECEV